MTCISVTARRSLSAYDGNTRLDRGSCSQRRFPANNAMQGLCEPCNGCPYGTRTDLAAGAAVAPHGFTARVSSGSNYHAKNSFLKLIKNVSLLACFNFLLRLKIESQIQPVRLTHVGPLQRPRPNRYGSRTGSPCRARIGPA